MIDSRKYRWYIYLLITNTNDKFDIFKKEWHEKKIKKGEKLGMKIQTIKKKKVKGRFVFVDTHIFIDTNIMIQRLPSSRL